MPHIIAPSERVGRAQRAKETMSANDSVALSRGLFGVFGRVDNLRLEEYYDGGLGGTSSKSAT